MVRLARCRIPATEKAVAITDIKLREFSGSSWVGNIKSTNSKGSSQNTLSSSGSYEWVCTEEGTIHVLAYYPSLGEWGYAVSWGCVRGYYDYLDEYPEIGGGGPGDSGDDPDQPCDDPTQLCEDGPGGGSQLDEDQVREDEVKRMVEGDEFALMDVPCEEIPKWAELSQYEVPQVVLDRLRDTPALSGSFIQKLEEAKGAVVNMDNFSVTVPANEMPNNWTAEEYLEHIRVNLNAYVDNSISLFQTYPGLDGELEKWEGEDPLGSILSIELTPSFPEGFDEDGSVVASGIGSNFWIFSTLYTSVDGYHPVSGNRLFGFIDNEDGTYSFYTRGVDRLSTSFYAWGNWLRDGIAFKTADNLWSSFQDKIKADFGSIATLDSTTYRPNYEDVKDVLNRTQSPVVLGCD